MTDDSQAKDNGTDGDDQFLEEVFPEELQEIASRQELALGEVNPELEYELNKWHSKNLSGYSEQQTPDTFFAKVKHKINIWFGRHPRKRNSPITRSTKYRLAGLAFSGGGIRSAAFNLGVVQAMAKHGLLKYIDYLSTVSGGGYIGSSISSLLNVDKTGTGKEAFPLHHELGEPEPTALRHLRNFANYLTPRNLVETLTIPALFLKGLILNFLVFLAYIIGAVWLTDTFYGAKLRKVLEAGNAFNWKDYIIISKYLFMVLLILIVLTPFIRWLREKAVTFFVKDYKISSRAYTLRKLHDQFLGRMLLAVIVVILFEVQPVAIYNYQHWLASFRNMAGEIGTWATVAASFIPFFFAPAATRNISKMSGKLFLYFLGILGPLILWVVYLRISTAFIIKQEDLVTFQPLGIEFGFDKMEIYGLTLLAYLLYILPFIDINRTSLHNFYRDRLSKAFIFQSCGDEINHVDNLRLSRLNRSGTMAPYQLINVALNLQGSKDINLRGRNADFFIFSKHFTGSRRTMFVSTRDMEREDLHLNLGTAMAISGAAASPNMGTITIKPLAFVMTLLNLRLGYWLTNPRYMQPGESERKIIQFFKDLFQRMLPRVGPLYLFKELLGKINARDRYINVSDGGHIENLGIYELLRRRCKFIIVSDAEADPDLAFGSLAKVIRYALIDMAIRIDIDLADLRKDDEGLVHKHCALGRIDYKDGETGHLLYIKSSISGDENEYIREYRKKHPSFPHESTADQFFNESQFENYRALGHHIVDEILEGHYETAQSKQQGPPHRCLDRWFNRLKYVLRPRFRLGDEFTELQSHLTSVENCYLDDKMKSYSSEMYPELDENFLDREVFHLCNIQLQLMENIFLRLQLDKPDNRKRPVNRGWINLFIRWAQSPSFRKAWVVSIGTFGVGFQLFCEETLGLETNVQLIKCTKDRLTPAEQAFLEEQNYDCCRHDATVTGDNVPSYILTASLGVMDDAGNTLHRFPVGFVKVIVHKVPCEGETASDGSVATLMAYRIRKYYRRMGLLKRTLEVLPSFLEAKMGNKPIMQVCLREDRERGGRHYGYFFEDLGYRVRPSNADKECNLHFPGTGCSST